MSDECAQQTCCSTQVAPERESVLVRRIRFFVVFTITYNLIEAVVALWAGERASSWALIGFGLDSVIEVSSAFAVAWQFAARTPAARAGRERSALRVIGVSFLALAAYVSMSAVFALATAARPEESVIGMVLAAVSLAIMPAVALTQRATGRELGSATAVADSGQALLCTYLSAALLVGLGLHALLGWWWADPVVALIIAAVAVREGVTALRGESCGCDGGMTLLAERG